MDQKKRAAVFLSSAIVIWSIENIFGLIFAPAYRNCSICGVLSVMNWIVYSLVGAVVFTVMFVYLWQHLKVRSGLKIGLVFAIIAAVPTTISFVLLTSLSTAFALAWFLTVFYEYAIAGWVAELVIKK